MTAVIRDAVYAISGNANNRHIRASNTVIKWQVLCRINTSDITLWSSALEYNCAVQADTNEAQAKGSGVRNFETGTIC